MKIAVVSALCANGYYLATRPGEVLGWWAKLIMASYELALALFFKPADKWHHYEAKKFLLKPILECPKCIAGQIALWWCVFAQVDFFEGISAIFTAIVLAKLLDKCLKD